MKLAILIPTIEGREWYYNRLIDILTPQMEKYKDDVVVITLKDKRGDKTTGEKRNILTQMAVDAGATHRAFIDDDDTVSDNYLDLNMPGVYGDYDCNTLIGIYSVNGHIDPMKHIFIHSLKYDRWFEDATRFYRSPNHLNTVKLSLVSDIPFPSKNEGEDALQSLAVAAAKVLKTEYEINVPFYHYLFRSKHDTHY